MSSSSAPVHVVPRAEGHGVVRLARQLAEAVGSPVWDPMAALTMPSTSVHLHLTDRIFGASAPEAAATVVALARRHRVSVTLHDLPQPGDGDAFETRARAYAQILAEVDSWVVSSHHEARLAAAHLAPGSAPAVIPLPIVSLSAAGSTRRSQREAGSAVVGVLGWIYPGKGHLETITASAGLPVVVRALGRVTPGHEHLLSDLEEHARAAGVGFEVTGWIAEAELPGRLAEVDVAVAAHRHVSASGSINSWTAMRRRPLVTRSDYAEEMARLRPGTIELVDAADLNEAIRSALRDPASTWLPDDVGTGPHLVDVAAAYERFWRQG